MLPPDPKRRWYHLTPGRFFIGLLAVQVFLLLSERFQWFAFNQKKGWTVLFGVGVVGLAILVMLIWGVVWLCLRRRFQFSFRSLLLFFLAVSVPLGWFACEMRQARKQRKAVAVIKAGGWVLYDHEFDKNGVAVPEARPTAPSWLLKLLGDDFFTEVVLVNCYSPGFDDKDAKYLRELTANLEALYLHNTQVTNAGLEHLKGMTSLQYLNLKNTQVTDEGVQRLQRALPNCEIFR